MISNYWGLVSLVDTHIGIILDALRDNDLVAETITVFTSDHGNMMGSHPLASKMVMFDEAVRVPLLLHIPGSEKNESRIETPVSQRFGSHASRCHGATDSRRITGGKLVAVPRR